MSVMYKDQQIIENITQTVKNKQDLRTTVLYSEVYRMKSEFNPEKLSSDKIVDEIIERLFWYMWISNKIAFQLQYQNEKINIVEYDEKIRANTHYSMIELLNELESLEYNIVTNDGNRFIPDKWIDLFDRMVSRLKSSIIDDQRSQLEK